VAHATPVRCPALYTQRNVECVASTSGVKLPATHLQASQAALQQLAESGGDGVNRKFLAPVFLALLVVSPSCHSL
jgi:hypothetical protein